MIVDKSASQPFWGVVCYWNLTHRIQL